MPKTLLTKILIGVLIVGLGVIAFKFLPKKDQEITSSGEKKQDISFTETNVCNLIPDKLIEEATGKEIVKTEWVALKTVKYCSYYTFYKEDFYGPGQGGGANIVIGFSNEDIKVLENDLKRTGNEFITTPQIPISHYLIKSRVGKIWQVILFVNDEWYLGIKANREAVSGEDLIKIALKILDKNSELFSLKTGQAQQSSAPLPQEEDIIRIFAELIKEKRVEEAVKMMKVENKNEIEAWITQFSSMKEIQVFKIEKANENNWTKNVHYYKVVFKIEMDPKSANAPIPYYGWSNGENIRWLTLEKINNVWKIANIASSP